MGGGWEPQPPPQKPPIVIQACLAPGASSVSAPERRVSLLRSIVKELAPPFCSRCERSSATAPLSCILEARPWPS